MDEIERVTPPWWFVKGRVVRCERCQRKQRVTLSRRVRLRERRCVCGGRLRLLRYWEGRAVAAPSVLP